MRGARVFRMNGARETRGYANVSGCLQRPLAVPRRTARAVKAPLGANGRTRSSMTDDCRSRRDLRENAADDLRVILQSLRMTATWQQYATRRRAGKQYTTLQRRLVWLSRNEIKGYPRHCQSLNPAADASRTRVCDQSASFRALHRAASATAAAPICRTEVRHRTFFKAS